MTGDTTVAHLIEKLAGPDIADLAGEYLGICPILRGNSPQGHFTKCLDPESDFENVARQF